MSMIKHTNDNPEQENRTRSTRISRLAAISLTLISFAALADAQQGVVSVIAPNGTPVSVPVVVRPGLGDIARGGNGIVAVDPMLLRMPWEFQQMVLAHEAAHGVGIMNETAADYFAGQMLRLAGFGPGQMQIVFASMARFLGSWGDATHLPVQARVQVVMAGYSGQ
jgi:hypothetical protein